MKHKDCEIFSFLLYHNTVFKTKNPSLFSLTQDWHGFSSTCRFFLKGKTRKPCTRKQLERSLWQSNPYFSALINKTETNGKPNNFYMWGHNAFATEALPSAAIFLAFCVPCHTSLMVCDVLSAGVNVLWTQWAFRLRGLETILTCKEGGMTSPSCSLQTEPSLWLETLTVSYIFAPDWREHLLSTESTLWDVHGKGFMEDRWKV